MFVGMPADSKTIPESIEGQLTAIVLADPAALHLDAVTIDDEMVILTVTSVQGQALCPICGQPSSRVHSSYERRPNDLALVGHQMRLRLNVRRFFCSNLACERKTFAERLPAILKPFARRTDRLTETLCAIGQALSGEAGSRQAERLAMPVSPDTLLRLVRHSDLPSPATPTVLGVDDFAWKKGQTYGTILVDLERHQVVDLLPDRSAESLAAWLQQHPGVKIISRDRGGTYAEGARRGAPNAEQVADRFHLLKNLREALEPLLSREHVHLAKLVVPAITSLDSISASNQVLAGTELTTCSVVLSDDSAVAQAINVPSEGSSQSIVDEPELPKPQTRTEQIQHDRRERRHARYEEIIELREQGTSIRSIAEQMGMARHTVRRYLATGKFPEIAQRRRMPSILDKFEPYLRQRWQEGRHNATLLYREIRDQGYSGSRPLVSRWAVQMRKLTPESTAPDVSGKAGVKPGPRNHKVEKRRKLSPSQAAWLLVCKPAALTTEQESALEQMRKASADIALAHDLAQDFTNMLREHQAGRLAAWLESAKKGCLAELRSFANGIERDLAAVTAGIALPWSNGQVEGQVNRLKFVKRSMYGRAKFDLLKHRVMAPT
jgi:transposase